MTTIGNMNTEFEFRNKFKKLLNEENCATVISAFNLFCSYDSKEALKVLWRMTYSQDTACEEVYKLGLDYLIIPPEKITVLRNELRYQYEQCVQPSFLQFYQGDDEKISTAFATLKNYSDAIVASVVCNLCTVFVESPDVGRILYLLNSEKETYYFGGIRAIGFDMLEADYLKPYHLEIHNILKAMDEHVPFYFKEEDKEEYDEEKNHPIENVEEEIEEAEDKEPDELKQQYKKVTPEEILKNMESFKKFAESDDLNMLISIAQLGFDLNEVMIKKEEIFNFIKATEDLIN